MTPELTFVHRLADAADRITSDAFELGGDLEHEVKPDGTPVSEVDRAVEEALLALVQRDRPGDAFLGEELGAHGHGRRRWVVDGIDGTSAFVSGSPLWGTLIALVQDDLPVLGLNTGPAQKRRWWAAAGHGAWTCGLEASGAGAAEPMTVAARRGERRPKAWVEVPPGHRTPPAVERLLQRVDHVPLTTHPGIMVAAGEVDLAVLVDGGPWDFAAVMPIVWEAGGRCFDLDEAEVHVPREPMVYVGGMDPEHLFKLMRT